LTHGKPACRRFEAGACVENAWISASWLSVGAGYPYSGSHEAPIPKAWSGRLRSHPATDYLQGDGPLSLPIALPDRLTQITYAIRVKALLVSHRTCRVRTHSGFFRALSVTAAVFRGSPSLFGGIAGACIAIWLLKIGAAGVLLR
jgi:hypothetical protein